jgi:hypothetical protein
MRQFATRGSALALCAFLILAAVASRAAAEGGTPVGTPAGRTETLVLVEHNDNIFALDQDPAGPSVGDWQVWGPNPLYDEANAADTGATSQGTCFTLHTAADCYANETIVFPDGSTLEIQGVESADGQPSRRTIVGGSGRFQGATGIVRVAPTADETEWTNTIEVVVP